MKSKSKGNSAGKILSSTRAINREIDREGRVPNQEKKRLTMNYCLSNIKEISCQKIANIQLFIGKPFLPVNAGLLLGIR